MFNSLGLLEFMHHKAPTYERITLEFLSTVTFKLDKRWRGSTYEIFGNMTFHLYNDDYEMTVEELGQCL